MSETTAIEAAENPEWSNLSRVQDCIWQMGRFVSERLCEQLGEEEAEKLSEAIFELHRGLLEELKEELRPISPLWKKNMRKNIQFTGY